MESTLSFYVKFSVVIRHRKDNGEKGTEILVYNCSKIITVNHTQLTSCTICKMQIAENNMCTERHAWKL